ncbi:MAG: flagellar motor protein MotB, partial [Sphingomonas sp.]
MRKLAIALALASTALATPALARDNSWYVGVEGGAMIVQDLHFDIGALPRAATVDHNYGYTVDGNIGYDFGAFRVETEVGYQSATVDRYTSTTTTAILAQNGLPANALPGTY